MRKAVSEAVQSEPVPSRIAERFALLKKHKRSGLVTFITANDPTPDVFAEILEGLPSAGADIIEVGIPFSDPMADGPSIQAASQRALKHHTTLNTFLRLPLRVSRRPVENDRGFSDVLRRIFGNRRFCLVG